MSTLTLLSIPVGNREDITLRVLKALKGDGSFLVEDTRNFKQLLNLYEISISGKKVEAFHDHNEQKISELIRRMNDGENFFLLSDAGSPLISDPAHPLIVETIRQGHTVDSMPGVTSVITALEISGAPPIPFHFRGFLPRQASKISEQFSLSFSESGSHIFFESPHRIMKTLETISKDFPDADIFLCRELTKKFQSVYRFKARDYEQEDILVKGEFVLIVYIAKAEKALASNLTKMAQDYYESRKPKQLAKLLGEILDIPSKDIYKGLNS